MGFDISVMDMVLMGRAPYKKMMERDSEEDYRIAEESLMKADMLGFKERSYESLSGGEKQRVILARAFCQDTECIILDEPANHLDIRYQISLFNTLIKSGKTVITSVHDLNTALRYCNKICVLKKGKIIASGNTEELITRELIRDVFQVDSRIIEVEGKPTVVFL